MPFEFKLPDIGEGIAEAEIIKWLVKEGDNVKSDQPIVQVETDKAVVDIPSPRAGTILKINYKQGESAKVGTVLVVIGDAGEKIKPSEKKEEVKVEKKIEKVEVKAVKEEEKGKSVVGQLPEAPDEEIIEKPLAHVMRGESQSAKVLASPAVRKMASELNVELHTIKGSGDEGRILSRDIDQFKHPDDVKPETNVTIKRVFESEGYVEKMPLKGIRKTIAVNMLKSASETASVTMMGDANIQKLWNIRGKEKSNFEAKGIKLTMLPFITKAVISALKENPMLNSSINGEEISIKKFYNIGIATETEVGLMVPVVKGADHKSITELAKEIGDLAEKARKRTITPNEMQGGTFTITNYGSYGGKYATPIINPGEAAILGIGTIFDHAQSIKDKVKTMKIVPLSLTFDHRIVDGSQAAQFLKSLIMYIEDPDHLLLEIE